MVPWKRVLALEVGLIVYWLNALHEHINVKVNLYSHVVVETCSCGGSLRLVISKCCLYCIILWRRLRKERREWVEMPTAAAVQQVSAAVCSESVACPDGQTTCLFSHCHSCLPHIMYFVELCSASSRLCERYHITCADHCHMRSCCVAQWIQNKLTADAEVQQLSNCCI